jgi:hypothetical protein
MLEEKNRLQKEAQQRLADIQRASEEVLRGCAWANFGRKCRIGLTRQRSESCSKIGASLKI